MKVVRPLVVILAVAAPLAGATAQDEPSRPFTIRVVDEATGRGVPLVELRTVDERVFLTDSDGIVAFREPGLMDRKVFFHVRSHGYEFPADGFGYRGKALDVVPGGEIELKIKRLNVAERLYRVTGGGIYRDSLIVGRDVPIAHPALDAQVLGQDSVMNVIYGGKLLWFWGDTSRPSYPLGNFHMSGATSLLPEVGGLEPDRGVDLEYFTGPDGFARGVCKMEGDGPTWLVAPTVFRDPEDGRERLLAAYNKIRPPLETYRRGFAEWDDEAEEFRHVADLPLDAPARIDGHTFLHKIDDSEYVIIHNPYPLTRVLAKPEAFLDIGRYESYTCLRDGSTLDDPKLDRDPEGRLRYAWRRGTPPVGPGEQTKLEKSGALKAGEGLFQLRDVETGEPVAAHSGSIAWNPYRGRWSMIAVEAGGSSSFLGEVWYAEADSPLGPWAYARKVVTHDKYTFYNPKQHPYFAGEDGRVLYFEGTYADTFSGNPVPTPLYNYNQMMYRLDLNDPRAHLPVAVRDISHDVGADQFSDSPGQADRPVAFFAADRPTPGLVPVFNGPAEGRHHVLTLGSGNLAAVGSDAAFFAVPADAPEPPKATVPLYEFRHDDGRRAYSTDPDLNLPGFQRVPDPIVRVWPDPWGGGAPWLD